jgi:inositol oxygenase
MDTKKNYTDTRSGVEETYKQLLENQTLNYVKGLRKNQTQFSKMSFIKMWDLLLLLNKIKDESDPDLDLPQNYHLYQTAEALNERYLNNNKLKTNIKIESLFTKKEWENCEYKSKYPLYLHELYDFVDWTWLLIVGFIHDAGKVLLLPEFGELPQWSVVGDTFPVGCEIDENFVYNDYHKNNQDYLKFDKNGIYFKNIGFERLFMSYGHDEYLSYVLEKNKIISIPKEAIYIIRFHSFYCWHTSRNEIPGYSHFASEYDWKMLPLLKAFQKGDLYSKNDNISKLDIKSLEPIYKELINKYFPEKLLC